MIANDRPVTRSNRDRKAKAQRDEAIFIVCCAVVFVVIAGCVVFFVIDILK
jgi:hypothetical protein